jgi:hypothetical protein
VTLRASVARSTKPTESKSKGVAYKAKTGVKQATRCVNARTEHLSKNVIDNQYHTSVKAPTKTKIEINTPKSVLTMPPI